MTNKISIGFTTLLLAITATSCGLKKEKITISDPVKVTVDAVDGANTALSQTYSGTIESGKGVDMSFAVAGTLKSVNVNVGQKVSKGQLLAELDATNLVHANNIAQATLAEAQDAYARLKKLHDANALPDIQWVEVQSKLKQAENAAAIAAKGVSDARIYSPINGVVSEKLADGGQTVAPAIPVVRIVGLGDVKASISVPEKEVGAMKAGRKATVYVDAVAGSPFDGVLIEQGVVANPLSHTFDVKFNVVNPTGDLLPGMLCNVKLEAISDSTSTDTRIIIPVQSVLLSSDNRNFVWMADKHKAQQRFVTIGEMLPDGVEITSGLAHGDTIITQGMQKVSNGTLIQY